MWNNFRRSPEYIHNIFVTGFWELWKKLNLYKQGSLTRINTFGVFTFCFVNNTRLISQFTSRPQFGKSLWTAVVSFMAKFQRITKTICIISNAPGKIFLLWYSWYGILDMVFLICYSFQAGSKEEQVKFLLKINLVSAFRSQHSQIYWSMNKVIQCFGEQKSDWYNIDGLYRGIW